MRRLRLAAHDLLNDLTIAALRLRLAVQRLLVEEYQPDPFGESSDPRMSQARFEALDGCLPARQPVSVLDIGCNEGFFVFRLAERGGLCLGLDLDNRALMMARARARIHGVENVAFLRWEVDTANALALPLVDAVICLSVFHHWVRYQGLEEARAILSAVASRARSHLVFETGQADELDARWASDLGFMGSDPDRWIRVELASLGFEQIQRVGEFPTTVSSRTRGLYVASR